ncbi:primosomal replication protein [Chromatiaceae bacterium AAb-1]|nr:primosomal replication protein [Chromatiaceae bacterium AAb-1]
MLPLQNLALQLDELLLQASEIDKTPSPGKPQDWFDSELFSCHSPLLSDYVNEAIRHLHHLTNSGPRLSEEAKQRLAQRLAAQVDALARGFSCYPVRQKYLKNRPARVQTVLTKLNHGSSQQLYQQLSEYQEFERRLLDMIEQEQRHPSVDSVSRNLALHSRLGRCRKAIYDVEQHILRLDKQLNY